MPTEDQLRWLETIEDPNELARSLIEGGFLVDSDEVLKGLINRARMGRGDASKLLASLVSAPASASVGKSSKARLERMREHHPALANTFVAGDQGQTLHGANYAEGPTEIDSSDWPPLPTYDGDRLLAIHLHENGGKIWPHIEGLSFPPPPGYKRGRVVTNPFAAKKTSRSSTLTALHVGRLYNAISFAMVKHGAIMNAHIIILWELIGVHDHQTAAKVMGRYLNEAQKWMRSAGRDQILHWVYVHEAPSTSGFHTHILASLPRHLRHEFEQWSRRAIARLAGRDEIPGKAYRLVVARQDSDAGAVSRCWSWFRYVTKQLGEGENFVVREPSGAQSHVPVRDVFKPWPLRSGVPVSCTQLTGGSHSIWTKAQMEVGFRSWLAQCQFDRMYVGEEIEIFRREQEKNAAPEQWVPGFTLGS